MSIEFARCTPIAADRWMLVAQSQFRYGNHETNKQRTRTPDEQRLESSQRVRDPRRCAPPEVVSVDSQRIWTRRAGIKVLSIGSELSPSTWVQNSKQNGRG